MSNLNTVKKATMDAMTALQRLLSLLDERGIEIEREIKPIFEWETPTSMSIKCKCGKLIHYGDKYCSDCGGKIKW